VTIPQPEPHPRPFPEPSDPSRRPDLPPKPEPQPDGIPTPNPEPRPRPLDRLRAFIVIGALISLFTACEEWHWHLSVNSDGLQLSIFIHDDGFIRRDRYRLRARSFDGTTRVLDVPRSGPLTLTGLEGGPVELTLLPPSGCRVLGQNPRTVNASPEERLSLTFEVTCSR
jgi:hypothetical protein